MLDRPRGPQHNLIAEMRRDGAVWFLVRLLLCLEFAWALLTPRLVNLIFECVSDSFRYVTRTGRTLDRPVELVSDLTDFKF